MQGLNLYPITLSQNSVQKRQSELIDKILKAPENSLILASELCVSGYDFDGFFKEENTTLRYQMLSSFDTILTQNIQMVLTPNKFFAFTRLTGHKGTNTYADTIKISNEFILLNDSQIFHTQNKCKLFKPNLEHEKFSAGDESEIKISNIEGIKIGILICFELRFSELWAKLKGCDIILVPAMWGKEREDAYLSLCKALAIANNCYVMFSSSLDLESSGVFLPTGELRKQVIFDQNLILNTKHVLGIY